MRTPAILALSAALAACQPATETSDASVPGEAADATSTADDKEDSGVFDGIAPSETVRFTGTEPFWGGEIARGQMTYSTPENVDGTTIAVDRFAGNNGLSFTGTLDGQALTLMVTPGSCSDGMSDRTYPFVATLRIGEDQRDGCAWTDGQPFQGSEAP